MIATFLNLGDAFNAAGGIAVLAAALLALLTTPRRAEWRRQREIVSQLSERVDQLDHELVEERQRRHAAERAAAAAEARAEQIAAYAIGPAAHQRLMGVLERIDQHLTTATSTIR